VPLGGFAPLPLRLGDDFTPEQHARLCADVAAMKRTAPLCVLSFVKAGASVTISNYIGRDGEGETAPDGSARITATVLGVGDVLLELAGTLDDATGETQPVNLVHARATLAQSGGGKTLTGCAENAVRVLTYDATNTLADCAATVVLYTADRDGIAASTTHADFRDYGGDLNKRASETEGERPYAFAWYDELRAMRGSAYSKEAGTLVHCENLAIARSEAARTRCAEKLYKNSIPSTADEKLSSWATALGVHSRNGDRPADIRARCSAKFRAVLAPTVRNVDEAIAALLGDVYVSSSRIIGSALSSPPAITYWPTFNPGPASHGIARDTSGDRAPWLSERYHLTVVVQRPAAMPEGEFLDLVNIQLHQLLDSMLPAWATFSWATGIGFVIGVSQLGFTGIHA
jgi:hypothetical protein